LTGFELAKFEIAGAADGDRPCMAKGFPEPLRARDRGGRRWAFDGFAGDNAAIDVIEGHDHEIGELAHSGTSSHRFSYFKGSLLQLRPLCLTQINLFIRRSKNKSGGTGNIPEHDLSPVVVGAGNANM
jgi:hypothetical protein